MICQVDQAFQLPSTDRNPRLTKASEENLDFRLARVGVYMVAVLWYTSVIAADVNQRATHVAIALIFVDIVTPFLVFRQCLS